MYGLLKDQMTDEVIVSFGDENVRAVPYDMPIIGYGTKNINTLRLWKLIYNRPWSWKIQSTGLSSCYSEKLEQKIYQEFFIQMTQLMKGKIKIKTTVFLCIYHYVERYLRKFKNTWKKFW